MCSDTRGTETLHAIIVDEADISQWVQCNVNLFICTSYVSASQTASKFRLQHAGCQICENKMQ